MWGLGLGGGGCGGGVNVCVWGGGYIWGEDMSVWVVVPNVMFVTP